MLNKYCMHTQKSQSYPPTLLYTYSCTQAYTIYTYIPHVCLYSKHLILASGTFIAWYPNHCLVMAIRWHVSASQLTIRAGYMARIPHTTCTQNHLHTYNNIQWWLKIRTHTMCVCIECKIIHMRVKHYSYILLILHVILMHVKWYSCVHSCE